MNQIRGSSIVTAIMPAYNRAAYVGQAIESVLAQTSEAWELVVVDDGSTDATLDVVRGYRDPRIRVIARDHEGIGGLGAMYRAALEASTAPLLAILDSDDTWPPDKLARQVPDFDDPGVVLSYGDGWLIDEFGCRYGRVTPSYPECDRTNRPVGAILPCLLSNNAILSPTVVVRRSALESVGGFWQPDGVPYADHPTWLLLAGQGAFAYHAEALGSWRRHAGQETSGRGTAETAYLDVVSSRLAEQGATGSSLPSKDALLRRHAERATINRWRLALLSDGWPEILRSFGRLMRTARPRVMAIAMLGLAARGVGSDLEWLQVRRHRVSWPSRRHMHTHRATVGVGPSGRQSGTPPDLVS